MAFNRREFVKLTGAAAGLATLGLPLVASAKGSASIVVIGGGYGGATAAKYCRQYMPDAKITLIEKDKYYYSCPFSNEVLGGDKTIEEIRFGYDGIAARGIDVVIDEVTGVDPAAKSVSTKGGQKVSYDYLVVSPGVSFKGNIEGYEGEQMNKMPHAWKAGEQTTLLRNQLEAMADGGVVMIVAPPNPFRCPPGPYERAAQIAHYLKHHKPASKVIIMDAKDKFSKQGLFMEGYNKHYEGMIEWRSAANDGKVNAVKGNKLITEFEEHEPAVANIIPAQQAGALAGAIGLTNESGWCPVDQRTFESSIIKDVYVIGDACIAGAMPKSGYAANSQGKVAAAAIAAKVGGYEMPDPSYVNTCYSLITPEHGISVAGVYRLEDGKIAGVKGAGGLSPAGASDATRQVEAMYARSWYANITADLFG
ncbi:MAG: FCSD flavin-binding domain-containing protein [Chromatiales bacterium]|nr:FCSD flavin-binding domain-containing protein [Gammaproteobacteria bacterium]MCP5352117.1 FCSD flavin-binding domain-containing protein [Chromatiales bacterium]